MDALDMIEAYLDRQVDEIPVVVEVRRERSLGSSRLGWARIICGPPCIQRIYEGQRQLDDLICNLAEDGREVRVIPVDTWIAMGDW